MMADRNIVGIATLVYKDCVAQRILYVHRIVELHLELLSPLPVLDSKKQLRDSPSMGDRLGSP
jgi:hypothetical protein